MRNEGLFDRHRATTSGCSTAAASARRRRSRATCSSRSTKGLRLFPQGDLGRHRHRARHVQDRHARPLARLRPGARRLRRRHSSARRHGRARQQRRWCAAATAIAAIYGMKPATVEEARARFRIQTRSHGAPHLCSSQAGFLIGRREAWDDGYELIGSGWRSQPALSSAARRAHRSDRQRRRRARPWPRGRACPTSKLVACFATDMPASISRTLRSRGVTPHDCGRRERARCRGSRDCADAGVVARRAEADRTVREGGGGRALAPRCILARQTRRYRGVSVGLGSRSRPRWKRSGCPWHGGDRAPNRPRAIARVRPLALSRDSDTFSSSPAEPLRRTPD